MVIHTLQVGVLGANCYLYPIDKTHCVAIDIGGDPDLILDYAQRHQLQIVAILLTHGHYDHVGGVEYVRRELAISVHVHSLDAPMLTSTDLSLARQMGVLLDPVKEMQTHEGECTLSFGTKCLQVIPTPGHTKGSVCYYSPEDSVMFTGDTLFSGSIGRTDFPGGSMTAMQHSLKQLAAFPPTTKLYPGHGASSTIDRELQMNPYMRRYV